VKRTELLLLSLSLLGTLCIVFHNYEYATLLGNYNCIKVQVTTTVTSTYSKGVQTNKPSVHSVHHHGSLFHRLSLAIHTGASGSSRGSCDCQARTWRCRAVSRRRNSSNTHYSCYSTYSAHTDCRKASLLLSLGTIVSCGISNLFYRARAHSNLVLQ